jgi:hypothetical protein
VASIGATRSTDLEDDMTTLDPRSATAVVTAPPWSRALRIAAGVCLIAAGLLNGLPQALTTVVAGELSFGEQIAWSADHPGWHAAEQTALLVSSLVMLLGLLGVAHACRFRAPVLTAVGTPLMVWGMWGFGNILAMGYVVSTVTPSVLSIDDALRLNEGLSGHPGIVATALLPHLVGSFLGVLLLSVAAWRSRAFPRTPAALLAAFLLWDFLLAPLGPIDPHLLLVVAWVWFGVHLLRMPDEIWRGAPGRS